MIRALVVDDAPLVRKGIRLYLQEEQDIEVIGEASDGPDAVAQISAHRPDLVFLDIQMPGFDGFEVIKRSRDAHIPAVVFITAHADYAMRAFDSNALSYLLKPINPARFREVVHRVRLLLRNDGEAQSTRPRAGAAEASEAMVPVGFDANKPLSRLLVKHGDGFLFLKTEEIDWIASTGEYASLHARKASFLIRTSLSDLMEKLDERQFARIHRCTIVNMDSVSEIHPRSHGDCDVLLQDGTVLRLSRSYRDNLLFRGS